MNTDEIRQLIDKYLAGDTSLSEEQTLRNYFAGKSVPKDLQLYAEIFDASQALAEETSPDKLSEPAIDKAIDQYEHFAALSRKIEEEVGPHSERTAGPYWLITAAAGIAAILIVFVAVQTGYIRIGEQEMPGDVIFTDTFNDPQAAKAATEKALTQISETFRESLKGLDNLSVIEESTDKLNKLSILDEIINKNLNIEALNNADKNDNNIKTINTNKEN